MIPFMIMLLFVLFVFEFVLASERFIKKIN